jgi:hypothetical protein
MLMNISAPFNDLWFKLLGGRKHFLFQRFLLSE